MCGRYLKDRNNEQSSETHLAIVCNVGIKILKEDSRAAKPLEHTTSYTDSHPNTFKFNEEHWERVLELMYGMFDVPSKHLRETLSACRMKENVEAVVQDAVEVNGDSMAGKKFDFNTEVYLRAERWLISTEESEELGDPDADAELREVNKFYFPIMRSLPAFLQAMNMDSCTMSPLEAPAREDEDDGKYEVVSHRKQTRKSQKYSELCKYGFRCTNGFKCTYAHTNKQHEFFKMQTNPSLRKSYKFLQCYKYTSTGCGYKGPMAYMCPYGHGFFCTFCQRDEDGGGKILLNVFFPGFLLHKCQNSTTYVLEADRVCISSS
jgi:hypothetical protein